MPQLLDLTIFGHRLRHFRRERGLTLDQLGALVGKPAPYLSLIENGKREPKLSFIEQLAGALAVPAADLLSAQPPSRRAALELSLERAQASALYRELNLPRLRATSALPDEALEHIITLFNAFRRGARARAASVEGAREVNAELRQKMRESDNYFEDIEGSARDALDAIGWEGRGALSERNVTDLVAHFGFEVRRTSELPASTRSVTDIRSHRIYVGQGDPRAARTVVLQTLGHFVLGHSEPRDFGEFLRQRVEANYFAGALLAPESAAVPSLRDAFERRDISIEDVKQIFDISYEMAAHRFTNLATKHLGIPVHFIRADQQGVIWKAYENNGVPFPSDGAGAIEGQRVCREWATRRVFHSADRFSTYYQYTATSNGLYWSATHVEAERQPYYAITVGVPADNARYFRGSDTKNRSVSRCPEGPCCREPSDELSAHWDGWTWPSSLAESHVLAAFPQGNFPGVDLTDVYEFLERNAPS